MIPRESTILIGHSYEEILAEYRRYVGDSSAELPGEVLDELIRQGKIST